METSQSIKEIAAALKKFQATAPTVKKDAENPHFRSKFASLDNIIETIRTPLADCDLSFAQFPDGDGLTTMLMHTSGEWLRSTANLKLTKEDPQGQGSAYTYARRYALAGMLGLATDEDDDGNEASAPRTRQTAPARPSAAKKVAKQPDPELVQIKDLLIGLEAPCDTVAEARASVEALTRLKLVPANYAEIIKVLSVKRAGKDPLGAFMDENKETAN